MTTLAKKHPLLTFYLLAFFISWLGWLPQILAALGVGFFAHPAFFLFLILAGIGPAAAAILTEGLEGGRPAVRDLLEPLKRWRIGWFMAIVVLLGPAVIASLVLWLSGLLGKPVSLPEETSWATVVLTSLGFFLVSLIPNTCEEIGWRGFAQRRLQQSRSALFSALVVGFFWAIWHLPLRFWQIGGNSDDRPLLPWMVGILFDGVTYAWVYNNSKGSLLAVSVYHVMFNATLSVFFTSFSSMHEWAMPLVLGGVAALVTMVYGAKRLAK